MGFPNILDPVQQSLSEVVNGLCLERSIGWVSVGPDSRVRSLGFLSYQAREKVAKPYVPRVWVLPRLRGPAMESVNDEDSFACC